MKLHELKPNPYSRKKQKRVGRGPSSGWGCTAGRGNNGQNARSGGGVRPGFEGGQMPLYRRLPKRGFKNFTKKMFNIINVKDLEIFEPDTKVTPELLIEYGLIKKIEKNGVKVLGNGEISKPLKVVAHKFSESAKRKIEEAKGNVEVIK